MSVRRAFEALFWSAVLGMTLAVPIAMIGLAVAFIAWLERL